MLARREHSRLELRRKLGAHADTEEIENLLEDLVAEGWLSDARAVEQLVHGRRGRLGSRRIRQELLEKGITDDLVARAMPQLEEGDFEAAQAVWCKKFGRLPCDMNERARQTRFLLNRGFTNDVIRRVLAGEDPEPPQRS